MGKIKKATRKFNQKGLKSELDRRHRQKKLKDAIKRREVVKARKRKGKVSANDDAPEHSGPIEDGRHVDELEDLVNAGSDDMGLDGPETDSSSEAEEDESQAHDQDSKMETDDDSDDKGKKGSASDGAELKKQVMQLKDADPEFYEFLKKNDPGALDVDDLDQLDGDDDDEEEEDDDDDDDDGGNESESGDNKEDKGDEETAAKDGQRVTLTKEMLSTWQEEVTKHHTIKALRRIISAFRAASVVNERSNKDISSAYHIDNDAVFNKVMVVALKYVPKELDYHLSQQDNRNPPSDNGKEKKKQQQQPQKNPAAISPSQHPAWRRLRLMVKSYLGSFLYMLRGLPETSMIQYMIKQSEATLPYLVCFPKLAREYIRTLLSYFGEPSSDDTIRLVSMLALRRIMVLDQNLALNIVLKGVYLTYVRNSNIKSIHSVPRVQLMRDSAVELYTINAKASYQHAFIYIRQMAIHLRNSMNVRSKESYKVIYNWQYINSLMFWTEIMAICCGDRVDELPELCEALESLIYPLVQIILGVARLVPTAKYYPLRMHCVSMLLRLRNATGVYIPILPLLLEIFESQEFTQRRPQKSTLAPLYFDACIKAPKQYEHTKVYLDSVLDNTYELLVECFAAEATRIAFPEWVVPATTRIRWWRKHASKHYPKFSKLLQGLLEKVDQNSKWVERHRIAFGFDPTNLDKANAFLRDVDPLTTPISTHAVALRRTKEKQRKVLIEAAKQDE